MSTIEQHIDGADAQRLFTPDLLLPCQMAPGATETPELRLQLAIIYDLINLAERFSRHAIQCERVAVRLTKQIAADREWVNNGDDSPFSFIACIEEIGGNADLWRDRLNAIYAGRLKLPKMKRLTRGGQRSPQPVQLRPNHHKQTVV